MANRRSWAWRDLAGRFGPGIVTGAADDDPSGTATGAQAGAQLGLGLLWAVLITLPLMAAVQEIADRTALATGRPLGALIRLRMGPAARAVTGVLLTAMFVANTLNIAADLLAVGSGMAMLGAGPAWLWSPLAGCAVCGLLVSRSFRVAQQVFKVLSLALLSYLVMMFSVPVPWAEVLRHTLIPHIEFSGDYPRLLMAILGTTISPYLFFWQNGHRLEQLRSGSTGRPVSLDERPETARRQVQRGSRIDVVAGMTLSNLVMFAVMVVTSSTLGAHGVHDIRTTTDAAQALRPLAGSFGQVLFALGFIGTGVLAVPVLAGSASMGISSFLGKQWGFTRSPRRAPLFYVLVAVGALGGAVLTFTPVNPIQLLILVALINGVTAAPVLAIMMVISGDERWMGEHRNGRLATTLGWLTVLLMIGGAIALVV